MFENVKADKHNLKHHISTVHEKKYLHNCTICGNNSATKSHLKIHISSVHEKKRPYQCSICKKYYLTSGQLKNHADVHSEERPFGCTICDMKFKRKPHVATHLKAIHGVVKSNTVSKNEIKDSN